MTNDDNVDPQTIDWGLVFKRLVAHTIEVAASKGWRGDASQLLAAGYSPEDVAEKVIVSHLENKRPWEPAKGPLIPWLRLGVEWEMKNLARSPALTRAVPIDDDLQADQHVEQIVVGRLDAIRSWNEVLDLAAGDRELDDLLFAI